jgi:hypothetical protein
MTDPMSIYTLKLEHGKFYVGRTRRPVDERYTEHIRSHGSAWTRVHKPIAIIDMFQTNDPFDENKTVYHMMEKYGIDNVRGGIFLDFKLKTSDWNHIKREINGARDRCFICEDDDHFASECVFRDIEPLPEALPNPQQRMSPTKARTIAERTGDRMESIMLKYNNEHCIQSISK